MYKVARMNKYFIYFDFYLSTICQNIKALQFFADDGVIKDRFTKEIFINY